MHHRKPLLALLGTLTGAGLVGLLAFGLTPALETPSAASTPATVVHALAPSLPAQQGFGTIKGRLVWGGGAVPEPKVVVQKGDTNVKDAQVCAVTDLFDRSLVIDPQTKGIAHGFAYLPRPTGTNPEAVKAVLKAAPEVVVDQQNCEFIPYSTAMHQQQPITFKSSDPVGHNVRYSGFVNPARNIALPPNGALKAQLKGERRPLQLNCDIHPWMKGWVFVFDHPFYAVTGEDGSFEITGVPAGTQNLVVWQETVGYATEGGARGMAVTVKPGEVVDVGEVKLVPRTAAAKAR